MISARHNTIPVKINGGFTPDIEEGKIFYGATGYIGLRNISGVEMSQLAPYAKALKAMLNKQP